MESLNVRANLITFVRFALNLNRKVMILADFSNSMVERNGIYVNYYGYYATITRSMNTITRVCAPSYKMFVFLSKFYFK